MGGNRLSNVPNILTMLRFAMVPAYLFVYFSDIPGKNYWAIAIVLLAGLTDVLDGYIARKYQLVTQMGIMLDPLADKLMMFAVFFTLFYSQKISFLAAGAIIFRDLAMILFGAVFHLQGKKTVPANFLGKLTTVLFYIVLLLLMTDLPIPAFSIWFVIGLSYFTTLIYFIRIKSIND